MNYRVLVRCTYCRTESSIQTHGDGCHACLRGVMQRVDEEGK